VESEVWARLDDAEVETQTDARSNTSAPNQQRLDALGGRMTEAHGLRDAYDQLEHEVVECSPSLSVPVSTPAQFAYADTPGVTDAEAIADRIADSPIAFLDVSTTNGDAWVRVPRLRLGLRRRQRRRVYGHDHDGRRDVRSSNRHLPRESFERIVEAIADAVDAPLRFDDHAENTPGQS